jgi:hypothetical protein
VGRLCRVCSHPHRTAIEAALIRGESAPKLSGLHGVSLEAVYWHREQHLPAYLLKAAEEEDVRHAIDHIAQLKAINAATVAVLEEALRKGDSHTVLRAVDRLQKQIELQAKLIGELDERAQVNVLISGEWLRLRTALLDVLQGYPEARQAIGEQIMELESTNGHEPSA